MLQLVEGSLQLTTPHLPHPHPHHHHHPASSYLQARQTQVRLPELDLGLSIKDIDPKP